MKRSVILFILFVFVLSPALCRADSDGCFCIGDGYLAYDFWRDDGYQYLHVVWIGGTHGIRGPMTIRMEPGQPHGYRCAPAKIEVFMWNRIDEYDVSEPGVMRFVRSRPALEGRAPEGFVSQNLGAWAKPGVVALTPPAGQHRYELRISKGTFFTTTELLELAPEGAPIKRLKLFEGNTSVHTHDFDIEEYPQQARSSPRPAV